MKSSRERRGPSAIRVIATVAVATLMLVALTLGGCGRNSEPTGDGQSTSGPTPEQQLEQLAPKQVTQYKGEKLGSITDFRENSIKGPQDVDIETYKLSIAGKVATPTALTYDEVLGLPKYTKVVELNCVEGWSVNCLWEGVKLTDVLAKAGFDPSAKVVIFRAADGYSSSLPLSYIQDNDILLAYRLNGVTLPMARGFPFQVVAEDKWGYKWVKWVTDIEVSDDTEFRGYWESRGYENDATLPSAK